MYKIQLCIGFLLASISIVSAKKIKGTVTGGGVPLPGVSISIKGEKRDSVTDFDGKYSIEVAEGKTLVFSYIGFVTKKVVVGKANTINVKLKEDVSSLDEVVVVGYAKARKKFLNSKLRIRSSISRKELSKVPRKMAPTIMYNSTRVPVQEFKNTESYASISENGFKNSLQTPLSTFSIDVDAASYSNMRRFVMNGQKPPKDAVRVEEMINYFKYQYKQPVNNDPFSINYEVAECPWNNENRLVHIGLQGKHLNTKEAPASNLVFLIDVSGSMSNHNKLPLLKKAFSLLVNQLRKKDKVSIVVYAGSSGVVLQPTSGNNKEKILNALNQLQSGGGTAGAAGLELAYQVAEKNFIKNGNNRIILATDGDFNVGQSSDNDLKRMIEERRNKGIYISVTGFGMGNYKDSKMEVIADKGNGNYAYIDNLLEAKKVFINEFGGTLFTIAKDVKIQIEFNPTHVKSYRLVGYENRLLNAEDFDDDKKDAGELGAGHTVTALYEIVPTETGDLTTGGLKYQTTQLKNSDELKKQLATVKFRYKHPKEEKSKLIVKEIMNNNQVLAASSKNFQFSSAVAGFGMLLRNSEYKCELTYQDVIQLAQQGKGTDEFGYRSEFIRLVGLASEL